MNLATAKKKAIELMDVHGLIDRGWIFEFDNGKRRFGQCDHGRKIISISRFTTPLRDDKYIINTILHEIAHALVGVGHGHDRVWQRKAIEIGCDGKTHSTDQSYPGRWRGICPNGHVRYRYKKEKPPVCSCGECSKKFNPKYLITWEQIDAEEEIRKLKGVD